jgi:hypothetical protein
MEDAEHVQVLIEVVAVVAEKVAQEQMGLQVLQVQRAQVEIIVLLLQQVLEYVV